MPSMGVLAAAEAGLALDHLVFLVGADHGVGNGRDRRGRRVRRGGARRAGATQGRRGPSSGWPGARTRHHRHRHRSRRVDMGRRSARSPLRRSLGTAWATGTASLRSCRVTDRARRARLGARPSGVTRARLVNQERTVVLWWDDWPVVVAGRAVGRGRGCRQQPGCRRVGRGACRRCARRAASTRGARSVPVGRSALPVDEGDDARALRNGGGRGGGVVPARRSGSSWRVWRSPAAGRRVTSEATPRWSRRSAAWCATRCGPSCGSRWATGQVWVWPTATSPRRSRHGPPHSARDRVVVVPPGESARFLAPMPVDAIGDPAIADVARRLGLRTLGAFAALDAAAVVGRFGAAGVAAHRRANGLAVRSLAPREPPPELSVEVTFDPPAETVDRVAFAARGRRIGIGRRVGRARSDRHRACHRSRNRSRRTPRRGGGARKARSNASAVAERVRWQAEGWLTDVAQRIDDDVPTAGITLLRLAPDEVHDHEGTSQSLWGGSTEASERVTRAIARVQGLLGPDAAATAVLVGGRGPGEQVQMIPWGDHACGRRRPRQRAVAGSRADSGAGAGARRAGPGRRARRRRRR